VNRSGNIYNVGVNAKDTWRHLGAFETAAAITGEKAVFNAVIVIKLSPLPGENQLLRAMSAMQRRHPFLRCNISRRRGRRVFVPLNRAIPLYNREINNDTDWIPVAESELNTPFRDPELPLVRLVRLSHREKEAGELILTFHHAIMDAPSAISLVNELLSKNPEHVAATSLPPPAPEKGFPRRFLAPWGKITSLPFLFRSMAEELPGALSIRKKKASPRNNKAWIHTATLPEAVSRELSRACRRRGISLNSLAGAAMLRTLHAGNGPSGKKRRRHISFADLRPRLSPPRETDSLCCSISMLRLTLSLNEDTSIWDTAVRLQARIERALSRGDLFSSVLWSPFMMRALFMGTGSRMADSALSLSGPVDVPESSGNVRLLDLHAFVSNFSRGPEFTAQARMFRGRLYWDMVFLESDMNRRDADTLAGDFTKMLKNAIKEDHAGSG